MDDTPVGRLVYGLARVVAIAGGIALLVVTAVTVISVVGRILIPLGLKPIQGDFEIVQVGVLFAIFTFLPWCHLERGHAIVAIVTDRFPVRLGAITELLWDVAMLVAAGFITWRLWAGLVDKIGNGESTFILRLPLWMIYSAGLIGSAVMVVAAAYCVLRSGANVISSTPVSPVSGTGE